ncbi:glycolate oxidase subunit GlcF [Pseudomonadota bacterium]
MRTDIDDQYKHRTDIAEADGILRSCVHCGFCTATCPTYQILGNELDSPRGRIYLIKQLLEGEKATEKTRLHLDRCLSCRSCETTCPSGVRYHRLLEIGRQLIDEQIPLATSDALVRNAMCHVFPSSRRVKLLLKTGALLKPILPYHLKAKLPPIRKIKFQPTAQHARRMLVLEGCVQPHTAPNTNAATRRVLERLGISLVSAPKAGCCGAINQHMSDAEQAKNHMRNNIDAWWPEIESGAEAIVLTASGCGLMVKEYGEVLKDDPRYAAKAERISELAKDISEIIRDQDLSPLANIGKNTKVAHHASCTLQHGQKLGGVVESILQACGYQLTHVRDSHLCCGSAGTYSLLQPTLSGQLLENKMSALLEEQPDVITSVNVGCQMHLESRADIPVKHWIELLDQI